MKTATTRATSYDACLQGCCQEAPDGEIRSFLTAGRPRFWHINPSRDQPRFVIAMHPVHTILLPTDFSTCARQTQRFALALARMHGAVLHVLHIAEPPVLSSSMQQVAWWGKAQARAGAAMDTAWSAAPSDGLQIVRTVQPGSREHDTASDVVQYASACDADLIIMGTHGRRGLNRLLVGSVTEAVMRQAPCPVLAVRNSNATTAEVNTMLVPLDLSEQSLHAWAYARKLARACDARLTLLHVTDVELLPSMSGALPHAPHVSTELAAWTRDEAEQLVKEALQEGIAATYMLASGDPGNVICQQAQRADLVVMTSHGRVGLDRLLLGSVAETVMRQAPCPVLVVRPTLKKQQQPLSSSQRAPQ